MMLFGMIAGVIDYFAGNVAKNIVDNVLLSIGLRNHNYADDSKNKVTNVAVVGPEGVSTTQTTETYKQAEIFNNYAKLIQMQDAWADFFGLQRFIQLIAPYLLLGTLEAGIIAAFVILLIFSASTA